MRDRHHGPDLFADFPLEAVMRRSYPQMSPARRQQILDECRLHGRMGAPRLPASVHIRGDELSESMLIRAIDEHDLGLAEREQEAPK